MNLLQMIRRSTMASRGRSACVSAGVIALCTVYLDSASAAPFHVRWEASSGLFPEQAGWVRFGADPTGAIRRDFVDGALQLDTRGLGMAFDLYDYDLHDVLLDAGESLEIRWSMRTLDTRRSYGRSDVRVTLFNELDQFVQIINGPQYVSESLYEFGYDEFIAPISNEQFHTYVLRTEDWRNYSQWVNGAFVFSGQLNGRALVHGPLVSFGDAVIGGDGSLSEWEFVEINVVPEPGQVAQMAVLLSFVITGKLRST